jgi:hypothetical protein
VKRSCGIKEQARVLDVARTYESKFCIVYDACMMSLVQPSGVWNVPGDSGLLEEQLMCQRG